METAFRAPAPMGAKAKAKAKAEVKGKQRAHQKGHAAVGQKQKIQKVAVLQVGISCQRNPLAAVGDKSVRGRELPVGRAEGDVVVAH